MSPLTVTHLTITTIQPPTNPLSAKSVRSVSTRTSSYAEDPYRAGADHILPLLRPQPDVNGAPCSEIFVPAGTTVLVNIAALNRDPGIWGSDAGEWKPARWLAPSPFLETRIPGVFGNMCVRQRILRFCYLMSPVRL